MIEINEYSRIKQVNDLKLKIFLCGRACVDNSGVERLIVRQYQDSIMLRKVVFFSLKMVKG